MASIMGNRTFKVLANPAVCSIGLDACAAQHDAVLFLYPLCVERLRKPEWTSIDNWRGWGNYEYVLYKAKDFWFAIQNLDHRCSVIVFTVIFGVLPSQY